MHEGTGRTYHESSVQEFLLTSVEKAANLNQSAMYVEGHRGEQKGGRLEQELQADAGTHRLERKTPTPLRREEKAASGLRKTPCPR